MRTVLLINHREQACGVQQFGQKIFKPLLDSTHYNIFYIDIDNAFELYYWVEQLQPHIMVYNYYNGATMPWLTPDVISTFKSRGIKQTVMYHENDKNGLYAMGFELVISQDPDDQNGVVRPIPEFDKPPIITYNKIPVVSSFGFGLGGKDFMRVVRTAVQQLPYAHIRLNIPFAKFGDEQGYGARSYVKACQDMITDSTTHNLTITHELMPQNRLLDWLYESDINCFFYEENYGRGLSGTLDYALAVKKPIAITKSWQFKHIWLRDDSMLIDTTTLPELLNRGVDYLQKFHDLWNTDTLIQSFERIFDTL
jgi:hypothetical protein